jgi:hypothetical protein
MTCKLDDRWDTVVTSEMEDPVDLAEAGKVTGLFSEPVRGEREEGSDEVATEAPNPNLLDEFDLAATQIVSVRQKKDIDNQT